MILERVCGSCGVAAAAAYVTPRQQFGKCTKPDEVKDLWFESNYSQTFSPKRAKIPRSHVQSKQPAGLIMI